MEPLVPEKQPYSKTIQSNPAFKELIEATSSEFAKLLKTKRISKLVKDSKLELPDLVFEFEKEVNETLEMTPEKCVEVCKVVTENLLEMIGYILNDDENQSQLKKSLALINTNYVNESNPIAFKNFAALMKYFSSFRILFTYSKKSGLRYDVTTKSLVLVVNTNKKGTTINYLSARELGKETLDIIINLELNYISAQTIQDIQPYVYQPNALSLPNSQLSKIMKQFKLATKLNFEIDCRYYTVEKVEGEIEEPFRIEDYQNYFTMLNLVEETTYALMVAIMSFQKTTNPAFSKYTKITLGITNEPLSTPATKCLEIKADDAKKTLSFTLYPTQWNTFNFTSTAKLISKITKFFLKDSIQRSELDEFSHLNLECDFFEAIRTTKQFEMIRLTIPKVENDSDKFLDINKWRAYLFNTNKMTMLDCKVHIQKDLMENARENELQVFYEPTAIEPVRYFLCLVLNSQFVVPPKVINFTDGKSNEILDEITKENSTEGSTSEKKIIVLERRYIPNERKRQKMNKLIKASSLATENFDISLRYGNAFSAQPKTIGMDNFRSKEVSFLYKGTHKKMFATATPHIKTLWLTDDHLALIVDAKETSEFTFSRPRSRYLKKSSLPYFKMYFNQKQAPFVSLKFTAKKEADLRKTKVFNGLNQLDIKLSPKKLSPKKKLTQSFLPEMSSGLKRLAETFAREEESYITPITPQRQFANINKPDQYKLFQEHNSLVNFKALENVKYSYAGDERTDYVRFYNADNQELVLDEMSNYKIYFRHSLNSEIVFPAELQFYSNSNFLVKWRPYIKGMYQVFINDVRIPLCNLLVLANNVSLEKSVINLPDLSDVAFYEEVIITAKLRDEYNNSIGNAERILSERHSELITFELSQSKNIEDLEVNTKLNDNGELTAMIKFIPTKEQVTTEKNVASIKITVMGKPYKEVKATVTGTSFKYRRTTLYKALAALNSTQPETKLSIKIRRFEWLDDFMKKVQLKSMKDPIRLYFQGSAKDFGGLRHELYASTGKYIKSLKTGLFAVNPRGKTSISVHAVTDPRKIKVMQYIGALTANSIMYKGLIGVDFATAFVKALYQEPVTFKDLEEILDPITFANYIRLRTMKEAEIKNLQLTFTVQDKELIPGGADRPVTKDNVEDYLQSLADYYIKSRNKDLMSAFREGFETVIPLPILKQHIRPEELQALTAGATEIKPDELLKCITIKNATSAATPGFFRQFIYEADQDTLRRFLTFATGSSSMPIDPADLSISIEFRRRDTNALPVAHSCTYSVEMPEYTSFTQMRTKFINALASGSEGYAIM